MLEHEEGMDAAEIVLQIAEDEVVEGELIVQRPVDNIVVTVVDDALASARRRQFRANMGGMNGDGRTISQLGGPGFAFGRQCVKGGGAFHRQRRRWCWSMRDEFSCRACSAS